MFVKKCRKRFIVRVNKIRKISTMMSDEPGAENILCELRNADGLEATEGKADNEEGGSGEIEKIGK